MYIRQIKTKQYDLLKRNLDKYLGRDPLNVFYQCKVKIDDKTYLLDFQLCESNKIMPLQAILLSDDVHKYKLVTDPNLLGALTELTLIRYSTKKFVPPISE